MLKVISCVFMILLVIPFSQAFSAETTDNAPTLTVYLNKDNIHIYQDSEGFAVVVGLVENKNSLTPVTNVKIQATFYDEYGETPLEVTQGNTTLQVIPPNGISPFSIRSETAHPDVSAASVSLLGFDSSVEKQKGLTVYSTDVFLDDIFRFSGILQNGGAPNSNTNVYLAYYDNFAPPRILEVSTIELGDVNSNAKVPFNFTKTLDFNAKGFLLFAESNIFISNFIDITMPLSQIPDKLITISKVFVEDSYGNKSSELEVDSTFYIKSETQIKFASEQIPDETAYTYYAQVKKSSENRNDPPTVEYIGKFDGRFIGTEMETQTLDWIPEESGFFFIETFVWDRNNVPIAQQGPYTLIIIN